jgi:hypothetical protein
MQETADRTSLTAHDCCMPQQTEAGWTRAGCCEGMGAFEGKAHTWSSWRRCWASALRSGSLQVTIARLPARQRTIACAACTTEGDFPPSGPECHVQLLKVAHLMPLQDNSIFQLHQASRLHPTHLPHDVLIGLQGEVLDDQLLGRHARDRDAALHHRRDDLRNSRMRET